MKQKFTTITSTCIALPIKNIDTDQIMPARFLKATSREGFGEKLFYDWRFTQDGEKKDGFPLNDERNKNAKFLVAGDNFGCGSSREHAAWALADYGIRAVISTSFADIHRNNELNNFVLPVKVSEGFLQSLFKAIAEDMGTEVTISLPSQTITCPKTGKTETFEINPYKKHCLMEGLDDIDYLLKNKADIEAYEKRRR